MRGKVKYVKREVWYKGRDVDWPSSDVHPLRITGTYAVLYNGDVVEIDEDDVREYFDCRRITGNIVASLSDEMHNVWIEYESDDDEYYLEGCLNDYI